MSARDNRTERRSVRLESEAKSQRVFNTFVQTYDEVRPHEALHDQTPASCWHPPTRPLTTRLTPPTYPGYFEVRRISNAGTFR